MKTFALFILLFIGYIVLQDLSSLALTGGKVGFLPYGSFVDLFDKNAHWKHYLTQGGSPFETVDSVAYSLNESYSLWVVFYWQVMLCLIGYRLYVVHFDRDLSDIGLSKEKIKNSAKVGLVVSLWFGVMVFAIFLGGLWLGDIRLDKELFYTDETSRMALREPLYFLAIFCAGCIGSALFEEFLFRGLLDSGLKKFLPVSMAIFVGAILFSLLHFNLDQMPFSLLCGLVAGVLRHRTGHVIAGMIFHFCGNFFIFCLLPLI